MICPETQKLCGSKFCLKRGFCENEAFAKIRALVKANPPKPTLAEFERLLDKYANSIFYPEMASEKRAALIDYVKRMGVE